VMEPTTTDPAGRLDIRELACERLFDEVPCYVCVQNRDLRIIDMNRKLADDFGPELGEPCYRALKRRPEPCPECIVLETFADGREHASEETLFDRNGTSRDMIVNTRTLKDRHGQVVAVMEVFTDITEKKALQTCLQDSFERFNTLFDQVPCFISVQNRDLRIIEANQHFKENFGHNFEGYCYEVYKRRDSPCDPCPVQQTFADGKVHCSEELVYDDAGNPVNVIVYTTPLLDTEGNISSVMEVSTDITMVRQLQDRLANVGALVASIAHSIKNVLDGLRGGVYITNLGFRDRDQEKIKAGWEMVERNVERVSSMILDMLYCTKDRTPNKRPVSVPRLAREVAELFTPRAEMAGIKFRAEVDESLPPVMAEPKDMHALLANLVSNAIDACCSDEDEAKEHRVEMEVAQEDGAAVVRVKDNGIGMDFETQKKLFHLFFSTKGAFGTGLGLLVAHKVAKEHGGNIAVESWPGKGSTFTVKIPFA
jgi:PAS domain S-box-containing protein